MHKIKTSEANWKVRDNTILDYLKVCRDAAEREEIFNIFKQNQHYKAILEHTKKETAINAFNEVLNANPHLLKILSKINHPNDLYGGPKMDSFGGKNFSYSTLQYIWVLNNLITHFKSLDDFKIIEIGGGYGGQCVTINEEFDFKHYCIIDLYEATLLQNKYLNKLLVKNFSTVSVDTYLGLSNLMDTECDLVISNYALSEVRDSLQNRYVEEILLKAKHGYITCNSDLKSLNLLKEKKDVKVLPDIKGERETNYILMW